MKKKGLLVLGILGVAILGYVFLDVFHKTEEEKVQEEIKSASDEYIQSRIDKHFDSATSTDPFGDDSQVNILLIGIDSRIGQTQGHCDAIQMFTINTSTQQVTITAVPRGTYSPLPPGTGTTSTDYYVSNACGLGGIDYGIKQIERILGIQSDYVAIVGFSQALGIIRSFDLPANKTLQWLRHRRGYQVGEPQRAHNHSTFLKTLLTQYGPSKLTDNGVFEYIIYNMVHTDLSFEQFTSIRDAVNEMHLDENPDNVLLRMRPHYLVQDFAFDPDTIDEHLHTYLDRIVPYLNNKDYSGATLEDVQNKLIAQIDAGLEDEQTIEWLYENNVWLQIEDDETRLSYEYEIVKSYARTLDSTEEKQKLLGDLVLEFEHIGADEWSQKARKDLEAIL